MKGDANEKYDQIYNILYTHSPTYIHTNTPWSLHIAKSKCTDITLKKEEYSQLLLM